MTDHTPAPRHATAVYPRCGDDGTASNAASSAANTPTRTAPRGAALFRPDSPLLVDDTPDAPPVTPLKRQWTPAKKRQFLVVLAETGCVSHAADAAGMSRESAYRLRTRTDAQDFAAAWTAALAVASRQLRDIALERTIEGQADSLIDGAGVTRSQRHRFDNKLLLHLLRTLPAPGSDGDKEAARFPALLNSVGRSERRRSFRRDRELTGIRIKRRLDAQKRIPESLGWRYGSDDDENAHLSAEKLMEHYMKHQEKLVAMEEDFHRYLAARADGTVFEDEDEYEDEEDEAYEDEGYEEDEEDEDAVRGAGTGIRAARGTPTRTRTRTIPRLSRDRVTLCDLQPPSSSQVI